MANTFRAEFSAYGVDDVVRGDADGLIDQQDPKQSFIPSTRRASASSGVVSKLHPAALTCPPPPKLRATCATSYFPLERRLTRNLPGFPSRARAAIWTVLMVRSSFTNSSVSSSVAPHLTKSSCTRIDQAIRSLHAVFILVSMMPSSFIPAIGR